MNLKSIPDLIALKESNQLECKLAAGRNGQGQLPDDFWPTYSAFANARGGLILLGIRELKTGQFEASGVENVDAVVSNLFNLANNQQKISLNLLAEQDVTQSQIDGKTIIAVRIRPASRKEKPVHVGLNPFTGTYRRYHDGDRLCDRDSVKKYLAEQVEDTRDSRIIAGFELNELDQSSIKSYRQILRDTRPDAIALDQEGIEFLRLIGAWRKDRETKEEGLTFAGLLMFGKLHDIMHTFPNYVVDYQEHGRTDSSNERWADRVTIDGTWSGNLFDFYRRVYRKIVSDLKIPFSLENGRRKDETVVHIALREALVNCLIHADYSERSAVTILKRPDAFIFRNPGLMRVPPDIARQGGDGDARNRALQHMFFLIGASDRAGTGVPTIYKGWKERGWLPPSFAQIDTPSDQTRLDLRMVDLLPVNAIEHLSGMFGDRFSALPAEQRLALATAATEGSVSNVRMQDICSLHRADITKMLQSLVKDGFLEQYGRTSGTTYVLQGSLTTEQDLDELLRALTINFPSLRDGDENEELDLQDEELPHKNEGLPSKNEGFSPQYEGLENFGADLVFETAKITLLTIHDLNQLPEPARNSLLDKTVVAKSKGKLTSKIMEDAIIDVCSGYYLSARVIAHLLARDERYVRDRFLAPLAQSGRIQRAYPKNLSDPRQSYTTP